VSVDGVGCVDCVDRCDFKGIMITVKSDKLLARCGAFALRRTWRSFTGRFVAMGTP
jgi:hypothetical protein